MLNNNNNHRKYWSIVENYAWITRPGTDEILSEVQAGFVQKGAVIEKDTYKVWNTAKSLFGVYRSTKSMPEVKKMPTFAYA